MNSKKSARLTVLVIGAAALVQGCSNSDLSEAQAWMEQERSKQGPRIEPLQNFPPYVASVYESAGLRSPFDLPRAADEDPRGDKVDAPDPTRVKEFLERFNVAELKMVGTMEQNGVRWALIDDGMGSVHRVTAGNYLGRNNGMIDSIDSTGLELVEVVVDGRGGWIERPRSINMTTQ